MINGSDEERERREKRTKPSIEEDEGEDDTSERRWIREQV